MFNLQRNVPAWERALRVALGALTAWAALAWLPAGPLLKDRPRHRGHARRDRPCRLLPGLRHGRAHTHQPRPVIAQPQLIEAARLGDSEAIEQLLRVCQPDLKRFARGDLRERLLASGYWLKDGAPAASSRRKRRKHWWERVSGCQLVARHQYFRRDLQAFVAVIAPRSAVSRSAPCPV